MRLFVLAAAPLLVASTTLAHSHHRRGPTTDTCAILDDDLVFADVEVDGKPYNAGHIDIGLCTLQVDDIVGHYNVTEAAAKVVGIDKVKSTVIDLIKKVGVQCAYPQHAMATVTHSNECDFVCMDGFFAMPPRHPTSCSCPFPMKECDGKCSHSCSTTPSPSRRQNEANCGKDLTMCGVPGATSKDAFKCTDVTSDSYTCGGCINPPPLNPASTGGVNCHDIPNVEEVSCLGGKCVVRTCKNGFTVSASKNDCVAEPHIKGTRGLPVLGTGHLSGVHVPGKVVDPKMRLTERGESVVGEVPGTGAAHQVLSAGKGVARGCNVNDAQC